MKTKAKPKSRKAKTSPVVKAVRATRNPKTNHAPAAQAISPVFGLLSLALICGTVLYGVSLFTK